jgi:hypothetical protein
MLQSTLLKRISSSKFITSLFHIRVDRLCPHPILYFTYSPIDCIQSLGIKLSSLKELLPTDQSLIRTYNGSHIAHSDSITYSHSLDGVVTILVYNSLNSFIHQSCPIHLYFFYYDYTSSIPNGINSNFN